MTTNSQRSRCDCHSAINSGHAAETQLAPTRHHWAGSLAVVVGTLKQRRIASNVQSRCGIVVVPRRSQVLHSWVVNTKTHVQERRLTAGGRMHNIVVRSRGHMRPCVPVIMQNRPMLPRLEWGRGPIKSIATISREPWVQGCSTATRDARNCGAEVPGKMHTCAHKKKWHAWHCANRSVCARGQVSF